MKTFSDQKNHEVSSRQSAQGCFATNLAMPGLGSLVGGRKVGLLQLALCLSGLAVSLGFGVKLGLNWAARGEYKYMWERSTYSAYQLAIQNRF